MGLEEIAWNGLYNAQPIKRSFAEKRIRRHFAMKMLSRRGIVKAVVRYE